MLGVRLLARSMARKRRPEPPLETDDLEQAALEALIRDLAKWDRCQPFEWFAWYRMRSAITEANIAATWRKRSQAAGPALAYGVDLAELPAPYTPDAYDADGCVICGADMSHRRPNALYCSPACRHKLNQLRAAVSDGS